ncbi:MAG TPA: cytochrome-c peroxidase, partial [Parafilimonas sp.]|nr:cytochrome-c peroxidase [Parafilimonas sp.]
MKIFIVISIISLALFAFSKETSVSSTSIFKTPSNFPEPVYDFKNNPVTQAGFQLGRDLFYDASFSRNYTISCSFCHIQSAAFTHHGHDISHGIDDLVTMRNTPPIMNLAWSTSFMWDGSVSKLDDQPNIPITDHVEMDCSLDTVVARLQADKDYPVLFKKAFGSSNITKQHVLKALSQFMLMCVSANSKYDKVMRHEGAMFTDDEAAGYKVFKKDCNSCHKEPLFTDYSFRSNGFNIVSSKDKGRFDVTHDSSDIYKFKVPSLRNLGYTEPYMHNGQLYQFKSIIPQYRFYVQDNPNLDTLLVHNGRRGFNMTNKEAEQLSDFLQTLNDSSFVKNPALSQPDIKHT